MTNYELLYIIPARVKDPSQARTAVLNIIKEKGGETWTELDFGKRRFSYAVDHARNGEYIGVEFQAETGILAQIKTALNVFDDVLRFQFSKIKNLSDKTAIKTDMLRSDNAIKTEETKIEMTAKEPIIVKELIKEKPLEAVVVEKETPVEIAQVKTLESTPPEPIAEEPKTAAKPHIRKKDDTHKVSLEDLDKKLEEILGEEVK